MSAALGTPIKLDKTRHLKFTANDMADLEDVLGYGITTLFQEKNFGFKSARAILWAGLKHEDHRLADRRIGLTKAGDFIQVWYDSGENIGTLYLTLLAAIQNDGWLPKSDEIEDEDAGRGAGAPLGTQETTSDE